MLADGSGSDSENSDGVFDGGRDVSSDDVIEGEAEAEAVSSVVPTKNLRY